MRISRRNLLHAAAGSLGLAGSMRSSAQAPAEVDIQTVIRSVIGDRIATPGKIGIDLPGVAGSGNSVALGIEVESPMTQADHVTRVHVFADRNPRPHLITVEFTPLLSVPAFTTNIRLSGTQDIIAYADTSDGRLWSARRHVEVTIGACDALMYRP